MLPIVGSWVHCSEVPGRVAWVPAGRVPHHPGPPRWPSRTWPRFPTLPEQVGSAGSPAMLGSRATDDTRPYGETRLSMLIAATRSLRGGAVAGQRAGNVGVEHPPGAGGRVDAAAAGERGVAVLGGDRSGRVDEHDPAAEWGGRVLGHHRTAAVTLTDRDVVVVLVGLHHRRDGVEDPVLVLDLDGLVD